MYKITESLAALGLELFFRNSDEFVSECLTLGLKRWFSGQFSIFNPCF
ncbi:hypothetical protein FHR87_002811 [Azomonas macrocytogenes]|uniref:Uncharacterized protein n=1 Tax=Azomonas macrocytogenes TaxID=69962 RepID=A0A839T8S1_AZOMA|nr:hypothetical protein [Azomonas macrocytogenes]